MNKINLNCLNSHLEIFNNLSLKIIHLRYGFTADGRCLLNKTLDELNSINYKHLKIANDSKVLLLIHQCCTSISFDDTELVSKCCQLIMNLLKYENLKITGQTLKISIHWCLESLKEKDNPIIELRALETLIENSSINVANNNLISSMIITENSQILNLVQNIKCSESVLIALQCIHIYIAQSISDDLEKLNNLKEFEICFNIFINHLCNQEHYSNQNLDKAIQIQILITCLNGLEDIISKNFDYFSRTNFGLILGVIKSYMLYDIKGIEFLKPEKLMPTHLNIPKISSTNITVREKTGGKVTKQRKQRINNNQQSQSNINQKTNSINETDSNIWSTDEMVPNLNSLKKTAIDSDFSSNTDNKRKNRIISEHVRQAALNLFSKIIKLVDKHTIFLYLCNFIRTDTLTDENVLTNCILKDPSVKGRILALNVLLQLLIQSKLYFTQNSSQDCIAFAPYSLVLGTMLNELHECIKFALNEKSVPVLIQILKCLSALIQATPYNRLLIRSLPETISNVKSFIYHKDLNVQVSSLIVLSCALDKEPILLEIKHILIEPQLLDDEKNDCNNDTKYSDNYQEEHDFRNTNQIPWVLEKCLKSLLSKDNIIAVKLESLQIISIMSRNYFNLLIMGHVNQLTTAINQTLLHKSMDLRLHAGRTIDFLGQAMIKYNNDVDLNQIANECIKFWDTLLNKSLIDLLQCKEYSILRATGCDCLSNIGDYVFENLPRNKQLLCKSLLLACSRDEENEVKGAAVRALAICSSYTSLKNDPSFVSDAIEAISRTLFHKNLAVRIKAYWSLGNLSDVIVLNRSNQIIINQVLGKDLLIKLLNVSIEGAKENDKIRVNTVRTLGNLLQLITNEMTLDLNLINLIKEAFQVLFTYSTTETNMKITWNCCYALGSAMKNSVLYNLNIHWQETAFHTLMDLVKNCKNFKVRINAAVALSSPLTRDLYLQFYIPIWLSLLIALQNSQIIDDFREFKHCDNLIEQICLTLGYLTTLLKIDDLIELFKVIETYYGLMKSHMIDVLNRILPEKSSILVDASTYLDLLITTNNSLNSDQILILNKLKQLFNL